MRINTFKCACGLKVNTTSEQYNCPKCETPMQIIDTYEDRTIDIISAPYVKPDVSKALEELVKAYDQVKAGRFTPEFWQKKRDIDALRFIISCLEEYQETGECNRIHHSLCNLYVMDKHDKRIHRIGKEDHDSLVVFSDGEIHYYNLQNGDGGTAKDEEGMGYVILKSDCGYLVGEYGIEDERFIPEITAYLKEVEGYTDEDIAKLNDMK